VQGEQKLEEWLKWRLRHGRYLRARTAIGAHALQTGLTALIEASGWLGGELRLALAEREEGAQLWVVRCWDSHEKDRILGTWGNSVTEVALKLHPFPHFLHDAIFLNNIEACTPERA